MSERNPHPNFLQDSKASISKVRTFASTKLNSSHLERRAIVYVRQSTPQQVAEHTESTARQYALVEKALTLGWTREQIEVIDDDQGLSGRTAVERLGFQRLLAEVSLDRVGLVLGLEMSRLARSCRDWHQLLELCAIFQTLLGDQDGLYDPTDFNDRLLLGMKGTMSEAELHILKGRMYQGRMNKAKRGELIVNPPTGYVRSGDGKRFEFDPDEQSRDAVRLIFEEFRKQRTIYRLVQYLDQHGIKMPIRILHGPDRGKLEWRRVNRKTIREMLHHPIYAGVYRYGYRHYDPRLKKPGKPKSGRVTNSLEQCQVLIRDCVPAYISWEEFEENQRLLEQNQSRPNKPGAPRRGPTLLSGLLYCGRCGQKLNSIYGGRQGSHRYACVRAMSRHAEPTCLSLVGRGLDQYVSGKVIEALEPASLEMCLTAMHEFERQHATIDKQWQQRIERATYEATRAERQYQAVEPENRLVARSLEAHWELQLKKLDEIHEQYRQWRDEKSPQLSSQQRELVRNLAQDFPALWHHEKTTNQDRKEIIRTLIDRIVVDIEGETEVTRLRIVWAGGFESKHAFRRKVMRSEQLTDFEQLLNRTVELRKSGLTLKETATQLNEAGFRTVRGNLFDSAKVCCFLVSRGIRLRPGTRTIERGQLKVDEWWIQDLAAELDIPRCTLANWCKRQWVTWRQLPGPKGRFILWANDEEVKRLRGLRDATRNPRTKLARYPADVTTRTQIGTEHSN